jgi:hypothetical protein
MASMAAAAARLSSSGGGPPLNQSGPRTESGDTRRRAPGHSAGATSSSGWVRSSRCTATNVAACQPRVSGGAPAGANVPGAAASASGAAGAAAGGPARAGLCAPGTRAAAGSELVCGGSRTTQGPAHSTSTRSPGASAGAYAGGRTREHVECSSVRGAGGGGASEVGCGQQGHCLNDTVARRPKKRRTHPHTYLGCTSGPAG